MRIAEADISEREDVHSQLRLISHLIPVIGNSGDEFDINDYYGLALLLDEVAHRIYPEERERWKESD